MNHRSLNLSICVVLYSSADVSRRFARELNASLVDFTDWEIVFYDNSPTHELADLVAFGSYFHDPANRGFSFANNQAILTSRYANIALINPDVFGFDIDFWSRLALNAIGRADARFIKLLNEDGSHQDCVGDVTSILRALQPRTDYAAIAHECPVGMGIMAFMLTTRDVIARVGLLDCDYPLYAEDMDWCQRAHDHGVPVVYDPSFSLIHLGGVSADDRWSRSEALTKKFNAERIFIDKHRRGIGWFILRVLNWAKAKVRT